MLKLLKNAGVVFVSVLIFTSCGAGAKNEIPANKTEETQSNGVSAVDLSYITQSGYIPMATDLYNNDKLLIYSVGNEDFKDGNTGKTYIYAYSMKNKKFDKNSLEVCGVGLIPGTEFDDHSSCFVGIDGNDNYRLSRIVFFDPNEARIIESIEIPKEIEVLNNITVSPDKRKIAYNTEEGLYLCNMDFTNKKLVIPVKAGADGKGNELSAPISWFSDSKRLFYMSFGSDSTTSGGILDTDTLQYTSYADLKDKNITLLSDDRVFFESVNTYFPCGFLDLRGKGSGLKTTVKSFGDINSKDYPREWIDNFTISPGGKYLAVSTTRLESQNKPEYKAILRILDALTGKTVTEYEKSYKDESTYQSFDYIHFFKDESGLVFVASQSDSDIRNIFIMDIAANK